VRQRLLQEHVEAGFEGRDRVPLVESVRRRDQDGVAVLVEVRLVLVGVNVELLVEPSARVGVDVHPADEGRAAVDKLRGVVVTDPAETDDTDGHVVRASHGPNSQRMLLRFTLRSAARNRVGEQRRDRTQRSRVIHSLACGSSGSVATSIRAGPSWASADVRASPTASRSVTRSARTPIPDATAATRSIAVSAQPYAPAGVVRPRRLLADNRVVVVGERDDGHVDPLRGQRVQLVNAHHEAAVTGEGDHVAVGVREFGADRRREPGPHRRPRSRIHVPRGASRGERDERPQPEPAGVRGDDRLCWERFADLAEDLDGTEGIVGAALVSERGESLSVCGPDRVGTGGAGRLRMRSRARRLTGQHLLLLVSQPVPERLQESVSVRDDPGSAS